MPCHHCKKPGHCRNQCRQLKRGKEQGQNNKNSAGNSNIIGGQINPNSHNKTPYTTNTKSINNQTDRKPTPVYPPHETCGTTNQSTEKCYFGAIAANRPPPRNIWQEGQNQDQQRNAQNNSDGNVPAAAQILNQERHVFTPELRVTDQRQLKY